METSAQSLKTSINKVLVKYFPLTETLVNLTHIDGLANSDMGASRGKQLALHQRYDQQPHVRVSWSSGTVGPQEHG